MVAVGVEGLPQVGGNNGLADIEHGVPHLLDAVDHEQPGHQVFRMFLALQPRGVFFHQLLAVPVQARLYPANLEGQPGIVLTDRRFNPVKPPTDLAHHDGTAASTGTALVLKLVQLLDTFAAQARDTFQVCRNRFNGAQ